MLSRPSQIRRFSYQKLAESTRHYEIVVYIFYCRCYTADLGDENVDQIRDGVLRGTCEVCGDIKWARGIFRKLADKSDQLCPQSMREDQSQQLSYCPSVCFVTFPETIIFRLRQVVCSMQNSSISHHGIPVLHLRG